MIEPLETQHLYDSVDITSGAMRAGDKSYPLLKFQFTTSGSEEPPVVVHFVGTPVMLDDLRRLLRDAVRQAIQHAQEPPA